MSLGHRANGGRILVATNRSVEPFPAPRGRPTLVCGSAGSGRAGAQVTL